MLFISGLIIDLLKPKCRPASYFNYENKQQISIGNSWNAKVTCICFPEPIFDRLSAIIPPARIVAETQQLGLRQCIYLYSLKLNNDYYGSKILFNKILRRLSFAFPCVVI